MVYSLPLWHSCTVCAQEQDTLASVSVSASPLSLVSGRMFYNSSGSTWLTVHNLQLWMINGKKAHFIHCPAYLSAAHWYSSWRCGEKHSWMYGCGLQWRGFYTESFRSTARSCLGAACWCSWVHIQVPKPTSKSDKMLSTNIIGFCNILIAR